MTKDKLIRIAIDGPGGSGKSTIAKTLAKELNIEYIDTGAMYRAIALKIINNNVDLNDSKKLKDLIDNTTIDFFSGDIILDGKNVNDKIRTPEVSMMASKSSALKQIRSKLVAIQRHIGQTKSVIMDGRDIGTNVLNDAEYKYYMVASVDVRANRRYKELLEKGEKITVEDVKKDIEQRDNNDMTRKLNPLCQAKDAKLIDTTNMSIHEVIEHIKKEVKNGQN